MNKFYFENDNGELEEISVDELLDRLNKTNFTIELWDIDDEGNLYFQENTYGKYE